jgi:hypothetical protein
MRSATALPLCAKRDSRAVQARSSRRGTTSRCRRYNCQLALLRSGCCVFERGKDVLAFQVEVIGQQLVNAGASSKPTEHRANGDASVANAGQVAHPIWIDGDSLLGHRCTSSPVRYLVCGANARWNRPAIGAHPRLVSGPPVEPNPPRAGHPRKKAADGIRTHDLLHGN